ncbi:MAG: aldo/keto reductase family protein [Spirochaetales bacterium]|nr:aldo/keto reductase family protein [Spirochaetales bacterium]
MQYRNIGKSGLKTSEIAYGSWLTFGNQVELDKARKIILRAFELGVNYFDTADIYEAGKAESLLGEILPKLNRRHYIIATKAFWPMSDQETDKGLNRKHIIDSISGSLERLRLKYVDIFYCHRFDPDVSLVETLEAVEDIIRKGKTLYWGTSEWTAAQIREAWNICEDRGWHLPIVNQPLYNMIHRGIEREILPTCNKLGMGTASFSPLSQGILTGKYSGGTIPEDSRGANKGQNMWMKHHLTDIQLLDRVDKLGPIAERYNCSIAQLALAWLLHQPGIASVIVGATSIRQLENNIGASGIILSKADLEEIDILFPA